MDGVRSGGWLRGGYRLQSHSPSTWVKVAAELGLDPDRTVARVGELALAAPKAFAAAAAAPDVKALRRPLTRRVVDTVAARAAGCARPLGAGGSPGMGRRPGCRVR